MCGIAGYINISNSNFECDDVLLQHFHESIAHRGPNGYGIWKSLIHQIALVHRRLSIIDLSDAGKGPMLDKKGSVVISYNGEIYNHQSLRTELESLGYTYFSNTDTETIIYAYQEWGIACIERFEGMFAIALFDIEKNELYLIRDRIGVKPLYFSLQGSILSFASEIKALWQLPWIEKKINESALYHYLTFLATPAPSTLYQGIYKLPSSFYAKVDAKRTITFHEWYTPIKKISDSEKNEFEREEFCIEGIRDLLRASIKKRMMSDVPFGVFLSGGIDSSLNVALMSEFTDQVKTFNVSFSDGPQFDESQWARKVSALYNTQHHEITISEKEAFEFFQTMVYHQDEPLADCVCIPLYYVSKLLKDSGVTVVQVGEGSDELFCGYSTYARYLDIYNRIWSPTQSYIPAFARQGMYQIISRLFVHKMNHRDALKNWVEGKNFFWSGAIAFSELWKQQFIQHKELGNHDHIIEKIYSGLNVYGDSYEIVAYHLKKLKLLKPDVDFLTSMIYLELKQRLPELLLMRVDKMSMATSVESRVPFLDHKLVEFSLHIPSHFKYKNGITKYILKKAAEGILPHEIIYRKKMGFAAPTTHWFKDGTYFKQYFHDMMQTKRQILHEYVNTDSIEKLFEKNNQKNKDYSVQLWALQNLMANL